MKVHVFERYAPVSDALREYVLRKVDGLPRYFDQVVSLEVTLGVERGRHRAEVMGHLVNRKTIKAVATTNDMYASVDQAVDKLQRQLVRYKERLRVERKLGRAEPLPAEDEVPDSPPHGVMTEGATPRGPHIVRMETELRKPMSPEEAALELGESGQEFLMFINSEDDVPAVIFRRGDGQYGLIVPRR